MESILYMRILPIFANKSRVNSTAMGQGFQKVNCKKPHIASLKMNNTDVYMRLAEASMRDNRIEHELKSMGLI